MAAADVKADHDLLDGPSNDRFDRFKRDFVLSMEEFLAPRLLPVLSLSFLSVVIGLILTSQQLGGPPLCFRSCRTCLRSWRYAVPIANESAPIVSHNNYCGYENGTWNLSYFSIPYSVDCAIVGSL